MERNYKLRYVERQSHSMFLFGFYLPVRMPERDVSISFCAPLSTSHWANSSPNPPRPPVMMYDLVGGQEVREMAEILTASDLTGYSFSSSWTFPQEKKKKKESS